MELSSINPFARKQEIEAPQSNKTKEMIEISVGASDRIVDGIRNLLSIPAKLFLWNSKFGSGNISQETLDKMRNYLHENGLHDVRVSVNEYDPGSTWIRIMSNPKTSRLSKCTIGLADGIITTLAVSKLTGFPGDRFSPSANTIYLFSDDASIALHEAGHAKDFHTRENPVLYGLASRLPLVTLYQEAVATQNAIQYLRNKGDIPGVKKAFTLLTPALATYALYELWTLSELDLSSFLLCLFTLFGLGHLLGRYLAAQEKEEPSISVVSSSADKLLSAPHEAMKAVEG
ncbi:MAG: hypothetical protein KGR16_00470 [Verrucomicrobia bacterium]|nr:hypothetical protein [Verrucomicrobiota bacterium]MDE3046833.1 hypothetical protein [Verrucomicrobiota bacterium]